MRMTMILLWVEMQLVGMLVGEEVEETLSTMG
jgi:hypothetical protein